jgi:hypothetical protein
MQQPRSQQALQQNNQSMPWLQILLLRSFVEMMLQINSFLQ